MIEVTCPDCGKTRQVTQKTHAVRCRSCAKKYAIKNKLINYSKHLCAFCGKPFTPNNNKQIYCKGPHIRQCPICGKDYVEDNVENLKRPPVVCSYECRSKLTAATSIERYGCAAPGNNPVACSKREETMLKKYGVKYAMQSPEIREKARDSLIERYGVANVANVPEILERRTASVEAYWRAHGPISKLNNEFAERLKAAGIDIVMEYRIATKFYDMKLEYSDVLIEINPTYTHNLIGNHWGQGLDKYYHRDKSQLAQANGYRCIHVFDWDNRDKIVEMLKPKERVHARDCVIYRLNRNVGDEFLNRYHLQGSCRGQLLHLGLVHNGELLQVMTFGRPRYDKQHDVELLRLCTKFGVVVVGGASRLFSYATSEYGLSSIITYCDNSKFSGDVYGKIGMKLIRVTPPQIIWSRGDRYVTSRLLRSVGYNHLFDDDCTGPDAQSMVNTGWLPVADCGQKVFVYD